MLSPQASRSIGATSTRKPLTTMPAQFLEVMLRGVMVLMAPPRSSLPARCSPSAPMIDVGHPRHHPLPYPGSHQDRSPLVEDLQMSPSLIARLEASDGCSHRGS